MPASSENERAPLLQEPAGNVDATEDGISPSSSSPSLLAISKPSQSIKKVLTLTLGICLLGFLACVSLASLSDDKKGWHQKSGGKNGLGKRINEKNLSWRADEKMESIERVTNPGGRRSKRKKNNKSSYLSSLSSSSSSSSVGGKVTWELSEYASKDGKQESERKKNAANLVEALKENHVAKEDEEYEKPKRREQRAPIVVVGNMDKRNSNTNIDYLGSSYGEYAWEPPSDLPESFDVRDKWQECSDFIGEAWDQGECGSCWAIAPTKVMSDRLCIASGGKIQERLSAAEILSCGQLVSEFSFGSCEGGMPDDAYEFAKEFGVASGGKYGDEKGCAAYPFPPCHHPCHVQPTPTCPLKSESAQCQSDEDEHTRNEVAQHIDKLVHCPDGDYDCMAREIYNSGPVSSYAGTIYDEFYAYKDGAYRTSTDSETRGRSHGGHVIEVIGWQKESDGTYSWKIINSWLNWGDKGHGRIAVGELSIGDCVESATMLADTNVAR